MRGSWAVQKLLKRGSKPERKYDIMGDPLTFRDPLEGSTKATRDVLEEYDFGKTPYQYAPEGVQSILRDDDDQEK